MRIGILGAGRMGRLHGGNVGLVPALELAGVADANADAALRLAGELGTRPFADWQELVRAPDVDAVAVCSPPSAHAEHVAEAAESGKHVFCEKPLAWDLESCDRVLGAVERAGVVLQVGFNRRFDRNFRAVREAVERGRVGRPVLLRITSRDPDVPPPTYDSALGSLFLDSTVHDFDLARFLLGAEIVEVSARGGALIHPARAQLDTAVTTLVFDTGAVGAVDNCLLSAYGYDQRVEVHGDEGMALAENEVVSTAVLANADGFHAPALPHFFLERYGQAFVRELESFAEAVAGGPVAVTGADGRHAVAAALAAQRSVGEGRSVALGEVEPR